MNNGFFRCVVCEHEQVEISSEIWTCPNCGQSYPMLRGIPILVKNWEAHEKSLEEANLDLPHWYSGKQMNLEQSPYKHHLKKRKQYVEGIIQAHLKEKGVEKVDRLLDLGCGDGNHLSYLKRYAKDVYGSDYNLLRLVRALAGNSDITFYLADILDYPAKRNYFDIIFFNHVLEHISEDSLALREIFRILKPGGLLILGTPNEGVWWWQLAYKLQPEVRRATDHVNFYTLKSLKQRTKEQGFEIMTEKWLGWGVPHWSLDAKLRRYKIVDDLFENLGRMFIPQQASSLYLVATKK
ncbi:MAG: class I SAM-dependent methyltransferase [Chloroflexi bacterium]|nr:MAG: class I SAM-dependent methyltransferase [Chloroflexota bacterium]MBL1193142.1 class I SAM-dependent methyltransferase [Chloroflexota bacterium]NOH10435.1 class I SAM-dependent methyltransferase [Chloroflexota bacterium]